VTFYNGLTIGIAIGAFLAVFSAYCIDRAREFDDKEREK